MSSIHESSAILARVSQTTKERLIEQVEHLENLSAEATDAQKDRYDAMHRGASLVFSILSEDPICKPGTTNWLKQMDISQLEFAISEANKILADKRSQGKVRIYSVNPDNSETKWFHDKNEADRYFTKAASNELKCKWPSISLHPELVPVEDLPEYLGQKVADELLKNNLVNIEK